MPSLTSHVNDTMRAVANLFMVKKGAANSFTPQQSAVAAEKADEQRAEEQSLKREALAASQKKDEEAAAARQQQLDLAKDRQEHQKQKDAAAAEERRRAWNYGLRKDWLTDFYKRNEIFMKTGERVPNSFNSILEQFLVK